MTIFDRGGKVRVYDNGGKVNVSEQDKAALAKKRGVAAATISDAEKRKAFIAAQGEAEKSGKPDYEQLSREADDTLATGGMNKNVYDKGGKVKKVNVNDGKHVVAILKEGERVLTEKQNKKYEKSEAFDKENPAENAMEMPIYDKGGNVAATPFDMVSKPKKAPKTIHHHEYTKTHNGKHVVTHKHHDPSHKDEVHAFEKFGDAAQHMEQNPPMPEPQEAPEAGAPAAGAPPAA